MPLFEALSYLVAIGGVWAAYLLTKSFSGYLELFLITFGRYKMGARLDVTIVKHLCGHFLLSLLSPMLSLGVAIGIEIRDGQYSSQGFDVLDFAASVFGIWWWLRLDAYSFWSYLHGV